jgi:hypothetical protein
MKKKKKKKKKPTWQKEKKCENDASTDKQKWEQAMLGGGV